MSATVMSAINVMCSDAKSQAVKDLAEKYGFDVEEAQRFLNNENVVEEPKEKVKEKKVKEKVKEKKVKEPNVKVEEKSEEKVEEKVEEKSDDDKPKRKPKPNAYSLFSKDQRPVARLVLEAGLAEGEKLPGPVIQKELAKMWKALSDEERAPWKQAASDSE